jgi:hypothetical protein
MSSTDVVILKLPLNKKLRLRKTATKRLGFSTFVDLLDFPAVVNLDRGRLSRSISHGFVVTGRVSVASENSLIRGPSCQSSPQRLKRA